MTSTSTVSTTGSTSYLTGTISGLDTDSLIEAAVAQKTARADTLDAKVTANTTKISSYQTLQSLLDDITSSMSSLKSTTYSSLSTSTGNAFDDKTAYLTASDGSDATDIIAVSAESDAVAASYTVTVSQLAKAMKVASDSLDSSTALGQGGDFTIGVAGGTPATIAVTSDMTLSDLAEAINEQSDTTGVSATLLKVSAGAYKLVLSAADTNVDIALSDTSGVAAAIGLVDDSGDFTNVLQAAQPAIATIDGVTITSDSNQLTDTIPGLAISLLQITTTDQTVTLDVEADYADIKTAITDFIDAYNALRDFLDTNSAVSADGTVAEDAVLFADSLLRGVTKQLSATLSTKAGSDADANSLAALGVTLTADNKLELSDETTLDNLLLTDLDGLRSFFESGFTTTDSALKLLKNSSAASLDFTLDVTVTDGAISDVTAGGESGLFTVSGSRLVGAAGTLYEGLSFALVAGQSVSIGVKLTQGFADLVTTQLDAYANASTGLIQGEIERLNDASSDLSEKSTRIRDDAEIYRDRLIAKYSAMEQELYAAQVLQEQIKSILGSSSDSDE
ncbi:flagellar hook protein [Caulobacter segnis]|uniref:Flagellar hook-associated protein 2 n=2 Tax=Caulobacter segnis TaxID=88688 RepID=D5VEB3_CAUST|nr:flagellar filament capping protein FliD [Caulobacter segnis]ADG08936.1 flagellar hook-associated 2 domain protein [Caulobacter segnis ATCC 21756]AVQ00771.1 flagellar hook protein [Caulobacter segnis]